MVALVAVAVLVVAGVAALLVVRGSTTPTTTIDPCLIAPDGAMKMSGTLTGVDGTATLGVEFRAADRTLLHRGTIQVVGTDGRPVKWDAAGSTDSDTQGVICIVTTIRT